MKKYLIFRLISLSVFIGCVIVYFIVAYPKQQAGKHFNLAVAAFNQNDFQTAINEYQLAIKFQPNEPEIYHNLTLAYLQAEQMDAVIETGLKTLQLNSIDTEMHYYLGLAYEKKEADESALAEYQKYIQLAPNGEFAPDANQKIAILYEKLHPPQTVEEKLQKVNRDLDMINNALRAQHTAITAAQSTSQNQP
jgi:tetratricopeptide (TPR) repeat protein